MAAFDGRNRAHCDAFVARNYGCRVWLFLVILLRLALRGARTLWRPNRDAAPSGVSRSCRAAVHMGASPLHGTGVFARRALAKDEIFALESSLSNRMNDACDRSLATNPGGDLAAVRDWRARYVDLDRISAAVNVRMVRIAGVLFWQATRDVPVGTELVRFYHYPYWIIKWIHHELECRTGTTALTGAQFLADLPLLRFAIEDSDPHARRVFAPLVRFVKSMPS